MISMPESVFQRQFFGGGQNRKLRRCRAFWLSTPSLTGNLFWELIKEVKFTNFIVIFWPVHQGQVAGAMRYHHVNICYCLTWKYLTSASMAVIMRVGYDSPGSLANSWTVFTLWCYGLEGHDAMQPTRGVSAFRRKYCLCFQGRSGQSYGSVKLYRSTGKGREVRLIGFVGSLLGRLEASLPWFENVFIRNAMYSG